jgi:6-phosphogluconolactonase (cycloisomerase 2 family)
MPFCYAGTDDYDQLGDKYRKLINIYSVQGDGTLALAGNLEDGCTGANYLLESNGRLYACDGMGKAIVAMSISPETGALKVINKQSCDGLHDVPCFIDISKNGRWALTAAYMDGTVAVWPIAADGSLGACTDSKKEYGVYDPDEAEPVRQETAHAHQILLDPTNKCARSSQAAVERMLGQSLSLALFCTLAFLLQVGAGVRPRVR